MELFSRTERNELARRLAEHDDGILEELLRLAENNPARFAAVQEFVSWQGEASRIEQHRDRHGEAA